MAPPPPPSEGYAEVRRKLRELGYLDGRIERFVLRDLGAPGHTPGALGRAALAAAALGGPIVGGLLASAVVAANRPLLRPADGLVLWLYFGALAAVTLLVLNLLASALVAALAHRRGVRRGDTLRASLLVAIPTLAYWVTVGWHRPSGTSLLAEGTFLATALAATLLVAWLAGLVSLAGIIGRTGQVPDRARRQLSVVVAIVVFAMAVMLAARALADRGAGSRAGPAPFDVRPVAGRMLFVGVDGLDGELLEAVGPAGGAERFLAIFRASALFPLRRPAGPEPPEVWTTLVTGVPASVHGLRDAGAEVLPGVATPLLREAGPVPLAAALRFLLPTTTVPSSAGGRRVPALWEIVARKERAAAVGWWATWPAADEGTPGGGYVVSDRALARLLSGRDGDRDTAPASLFARLAAQFPSDRAAIRAEFESAFAGVSDERALRIAWESFLIDGWHLRTARLLRDDPEVRAAFLYLPGLEILRFRLLDERAGADVRRLASSQRVLEAYLRWLGSALEEVTAGGSGGSAVIVGDPGRGAGEGAEGFVAVRGTAGKGGCVAPAIAHLDVAPLVLTLLGYPASEEMPGKVPELCLDLASPPAPRIPTFGRSDPAVAAPAGERDPEMLERLRSLGYLR